MKRCLVFIVFSLIMFSACAEKQKYLFLSRSDFNELILEYPQDENIPLIVIRGEGTAWEFIGMISDEFIKAGFTRKDSLENKQKESLIEIFVSKERNSANISVKGKVISFSLVLEKKEIRRKMNQIVESIIDAFRTIE